MDYGDMTGNDEKGLTFTTLLAEIDLSEPNIVGELESERKVLGV